MMQHLPILPILIPLIGGLLMLLPPFNGIERYMIRRFASIILLLSQVACALWMTSTVIATGPMAYAVGDWQAPFGIILYVDKLAVLLVSLTAFLGLCITLYSFAGTDREGRYFHPLVQFQLLGIYGAFLTNDIFNLFVFFEVLLIASYSLLIHGGGKQRTGANVHYVILNLIGSSLFLFALGTLYGTTGTLNIAHMSQRIGELEGGQAIIAQVGGALLLVVFGLKSAMLPLHFWLPRTYEVATAPVAALFAIMTKVGVYCMFRVFTVIFGDDAGELSNMAQAWVWPLAILTMVAGSFGALASPNLRMLAGNLVLISVGTLLIAFSLRSVEASAAGMYYLIHSTLITAGLFLVADMIGQQRGKALDRFVMARRVQQPALLGAMFFFCAIAVAGLPPLSGFLGKLVILQAAHSAAEQIWVWGAILVSSLIAIIALSRAGTTLFWRHNNANKDANEETSVSKWQITGTVLLLAASPVVVVFGAPVLAFTQDAAQQLHDISSLLELLNLKGATAL